MVKTFVILLNNKHLIMYEYDTHYSELPITLDFRNSLCSITNHFTQYLWIHLKAIQSKLQLRQFVDFNSINPQCTLISIHPFCFEYIKVIHVIYEFTCYLQRFLNVRKIWSKTIINIFHISETIPIRKTCIMQQHWLIHMQNNYHSYMYGEQLSK